MISRCFLQGAFTATFLLSNAPLRAEEVEVVSFGAIWLGLLLYFLPEPAILRRRRGRPAPNEH